MEWRRHLNDRLLELQPERVCALDDEARQLSTQALPHVPVHASGQAKPDSPCTLAVGIRVMDGLTSRQAEHLINQTRLYIAPRILLAVHSDQPLDETAFRALGFTLSATDPMEDMRVYYYDIGTYKTVPDWLNARFWANPHRWQP